MENTDKSLEKLVKNLERLGSKIPDEDDFAEFLETVIQLLQKSNELLSEKIEEGDFTLNKKLENLSEKLNSYLVDLNKKVYKKDFDLFKVVFRQEIIGLIGNLDIPERVDLKPLEEKVDNLDQKIKKIEPENIQKEFDFIYKTIEKLQNKIIKELEKRKVGKTEFIGGGVVGRDLIKDIDLSTQLNGVLKTFNIQAVWNIFSVSLSSYPYGALRKGIDYTWTPTSITFTSEIDAETQLASGQKCILTVIQG